MAEEIYLVDIAFDEPRLTKLNPLKVHAVRSGNSDRFEDASIIIMVDYKSPSQLVDEYYEELNTLFDKIENQFGFSVIIAAHPRANIDDYQILFKNRDIIYGNTALLVRDCEFVITNHSTAINFAVIYQKPIILFTNRYLMNYDFEMLRMLFISSLNLTSINMSLPYELPQVFDVDEESFQNYKLKYIKKNDIEMTTWEIFYEQYLLKEFN